MMDHLTTDDLDRLITDADGLRVSIYLPTERKGTETQQNPIRFKNLVTGAVDELESRGIRGPEAETLLSPAIDLLNNHGFWQHQEHGLAVFIDEQGMASFRLPVDFEPLAVIGDRFHVKPLLPVVDVGGEFYVLALSHDHVRLLRGTRYTVSELELTDVPTSVDDALWYRDPDTQLQYHATSAGGTAAAFHGHGLTGDSSKNDLQAFFRAVDHGVAEIIDHSRAPVVLAGVGYLLPMYRQITDLEVLAEGVEGNPDRTSMEELHTRAWPLVAGLFEARRLDARDRLLAGGTQSTDAVADTVEAAVTGRVAALFVPAGEHKWGSFDPDSLQAAEGDGDGSTDLFDFAAAATWRHGGEVFVVEPDDIPGDGEVAALLRY